jgi:hypothetical protein
MASPLEDDNVKLEILRYKQDDLKLVQISQLTGVAKSTLHDFLMKKTYTKWWADYGERPVAAGSINDHHEDIEVLGQGTYIAISAQNNTFVHNKFVDSLEVLAEQKNAKILCGTFTYNKSGFLNLQKGSDDEEIWYDPRIKSYILDKPVMICDELQWCGELNVLPTAVNPLSGLHSYTRSASAIVPHAKMQLESIPTHKSLPAKMMYTTGSVTKRNYIQKKAGQKAEFHHVFGALLIEVDQDGDAFVRQLVAEKDTGCFYDLNQYYTPNGVYHSDYVEAINWGDLHSEKKDHRVYDVSFGREDSIIDILRPKYQFGNDVLDFTSRNHHNIGDPYFRFKKHLRGNDSVKDNIFDVIDTLQMMERDFCQTVIVESNHDLALEKWLKNSDYKTDPENAIFFLECQLKKYRTIERGEDDFSIFEWAVKWNCKELSHLRFLKTDESFRICDEDGNGIECGQHGHNGANGSRGGVGVFQRMGSRYNVGHTHTAMIKDGVYYAGVSGSLDMEYNIGGSSWSNSHIVTYPNGKRCIITIKNGKWRVGV